MCVVVKGSGRRQTLYMKLMIFLKRPVVAAADRAYVCVNWVVCPETAADIARVCVVVGGGSH